jgi:DNA primase
MNDTAKYLIRATIAADGVVERSDVVGAVFGQTEGLLGDELDLRDLQESSRVGRIDVSIRSENGQSFGEVTVASSLDKVETAILAASLETIDRIGPCGAAVEVTSIEDVRAAKRREVVERAKELVASGFEETSLGSDDVLEEVREAARVAGIVDYEGLPAGPRVGDSDAVIIVEGRADVSTLLECGIKNAVAVEGTNVPDAVADLTASRTVTAFLDGDRGGELILRELAQVGDVEYVAFAPPGESVEDLDRAAVFDALRGKVPYETLADEPNLREAAGSGATSTADAGVIVGADEATGPPDAASRNGPTDASSDVDDTDVDGTDDASSDGDATDTDDGPIDGVRDDTDGEGEPVDGDDAGPDRPNTDGDDEDATAGDDADGDSDDAAAAVDHTPRSFEEHVQEVVDGDSGRARLLDDDLGVLTEVEATDAFDAVEGAADPPMAVVLDGTVDQRLVDVAAQRGVETLFGRDAGDLVKRPVGTRIVTVADRAVEA